MASRPARKAPAARAVSMGCSLPARSPTPVPAWPSCRSATGAKSTLKPRRLRPLPHSRPQRSHPTGALAAPDACGSWASLPPSPEAGTRHPLPGPRRRAGAVPGPTGAEDPGSGRGSVQARRWGSGSRLRAKNTRPPGVKPGSTWVPSMPSKPIQRSSCPAGFVMGRILQERSRAFRTCGSRVEAGAVEAVQGRLQVGLEQDTRSSPRGRRRNASRSPGTARPGRTPRPRAAPDGHPDSPRTSPTPGPPSDPPAGAGSRRGHRAARPCAAG